MWNEILLISIHQSLHHPCFQVTHNFSSYETVNLLSLRQLVTRAPPRAYTPCRPPTGSSPSPCCSPSWEFKSPMRPFCSAVFISSRGNPGSTRGTSTRLLRTKTILLTKTQSSLSSVRSSTLLSRSSMQRATLTGAISTQTVSWMHAAHCSCVLVINYAKFVRYVHTLFMFA